jgi:integrase
MTARRDFGAVRRLPSGRWQVRYRNDAGQLVAAARTFATKAEASNHLATIQSDQARGLWVDPSAGRMPFEEYAETWMTQRELRPRTRELYRGILSNHVFPTFGQVPLAKISGASVRAWRAERLDSGVGPSTVAKAYRLMKAIFATAVADDLVARTPCRLPGASAERPAERIPPTIAEVEVIANAINHRFRLLVLLGAWSGLRWGELLALTRSSVDLLHGTVTVTRALVELGSGAFFGPPKSDAGRRTVYIPPDLLPEIERHLDLYVERDQEALIFRGPRGGLVRRNNFIKPWDAARCAAGRPDLHFHDLRHLAATLTATTGATTRELMARMGHASPRAALIYQHATRDRDAVIAQALSDLRLAVVGELPPHNYPPGVNESSDGIADEDVRRA